MHTQARGSVMALYEEASQTHVYVHIYMYGMEELIYSTYM